MSKDILTLDHIKNPLEAIELAIADATIVFKQKGYVKDMTNWHTPGRESLGGTTGICYVCMAGAIIANSLKAKHGEQNVPGDYENVGEHSLTSILALYSRTEGVLKSIDSIRCGGYGYIAHYTEDYNRWEKCMLRAQAKSNTRLLKTGNLRTWRALAKRVRSNADELGLL